MQTLPKRSILYLDDEPACLDVFEQIFNADYEIRTALTPVEARLALKEYPADIVISDQSMPEMSGAEFLREVAEQYPASFRVMLTGNAMIGDMIFEISGGLVNLFVAKPWSIEYMQQALERASASFELRAREQQGTIPQNTSDHISPFPVTSRSS